VFLLLTPLLWELTKQLVGQWLALCSMSIFTDFNSADNAAFLSELYDVLSVSPRHL